MEQPIQQKEDLRWRLRLIFLYYASYADRNNYKLLKTQNYRRFLIDSQSVTDQAGFPPFDIAFRKVHTSAIKLSQFQDLLPVIAQLVYRNKNRKEAFQLFLRKHMEKLYNEILKHSEFGTDVLAIHNLKIQSATLSLMDSPAVHKAYQKYIETTSMHQKEPEHTFEQVHIFLSDFEVSPKLVYKALVYLVFFQQLTFKHTNTWGIQDLQNLLICIAQLYWRRIEEEPASQEVKVVRLLQQMETSLGFKKMVDKALKQNAVLISFFKFPYHMPGDLRQSRDQRSNNAERVGTHVSLEGSRYMSTKREKPVDISTVRKLAQEQVELATRLREVFQRLCSYGQVGNTHTLKSIKVLKYFKGLNILSTLEQTWVDITIADLCRTSSSGKIQFSQFVQLLKLSADKLQVTWQGLMHYLADHSQAELANSRAYFSNTNSKVSNQSVEPQAVEILFYVQKPLERIYNFYKVGKKCLAFQDLSHLLFEFQIFPTFVSKAKLYFFFQNRSKAPNQVRKLAGDVALDFRGLMFVLADIAHEIGDNLRDEQRILFLLQRMQQSQGHRKLLGSQGSNLIGDLRSRYASIYKLNIDRHSPAKQQGFQQLLSGYRL